MLTVVAQAVTSWMILAFGIVALVAEKSTPAAREPQRSAWKLTGLTFVCAGILGTLHKGWAAYAFMAGPGSPPWNEYLHWAPALNNARGLLMIAFSLGLTALAITPIERRRGAVAGTMIGAGAALFLGALMGWAEGPFISGGHYIVLTTVNLVTMFVLAAGLLLHLSRDTLDRLLWTCLSLYSVHLAIGSLWMAAKTWFDVPGAVVPRGIDQYALAIACYLLMIVVGLRYIRHQRRNTYVPTMLEHLRPMRVPTM